MSTTRVYFVSEEKMREGFTKIVEANPLMAEENAFFEILICFAGQETNPQNAILLLTDALTHVTKKNAVSLIDVSEAMLDDAETVKLVGDSLERIAEKMAERKRPSGGKVHFANKPFMARVSSYGHDPIHCTPVVYDSMSNCGVGIIYEDGRCEVWGMVTPRNLIAAWRGTEVLRHLDAIVHGTLASAYYTGSRNPHKSDMEHYVEPIIKKMGQVTYDEIMSMFVPEEIIRAILDNQQIDFAPDIYPITDEVRAGTIQWRQEFADVGIKHPDEIDKEARVKEETIEKFEELLASYAKSRDLPRDCMGMSNVEGALLTLIKKGADRCLPNYTLVALAGVVGEVALTQFSMSMFSFGPISSEEYDSRVNEKKEEAIIHSAVWLASNQGGTQLSQFLQKLLFWKKALNYETKDSAKRLLRRLFEEYFPVKTENAPA